MNVYSFLLELRDKALSYYKDRLISLVVFGSVAKNTWTPESDIDVLIVLEEKSKSSYRTYMEFYENVEEKLKPRMRLSPIFLKGTSLRETLPWLWDTSFIILYDKNDFFKNFLKKLESFKSKLKFIKEPMPHYVLKDGE